MPKLSTTRYQQDSSTGIWSRAEYTGIAYSDGDAIEERIAAIISSANDISLFSDELRENCTDWPSLYHLSAQRANILRPFAPQLNGDILEIGAGCGAITRYLGECGADVVALEGSPRRAGMTRSRTRDLPNVTVVAEAFDKFETDHRFDVVTLIGVLEYANLFTSGKNPALSMLQRARTFLKPGGRLIVAIENRFGLKYFAGAAEDHVGRVMYGIEDRYRDDQPRTYGRRELTKLLSDAGFGRSSFYAPFPDYKLPNSIVSAHAFSASDFDAAALAAQSVPYDPQMPTVRLFAPELAWPKIIENDLGMDLSNSFLVQAINGTGDTEEETPLAWHYSTARRSLYCKETLFQRTSDGKVSAFYNRLAAAGASSYNSDFMSFSLPKVSPYAYGRPLSEKIISTLSKDGWIFSEISSYFRDYIDILGSFISDRKDSSVKIDSFEFILPDNFVDAGPHNIIIDDDGDAHLIDQEWELVGGVSVGFLVFRSLLNILSFTSRIGATEEAFDPTPAGLILAIAKDLGWSLTESVLEEFVDSEARLQSVVKGGQNNHTVLHNWLHKGSLYPELVGTDEKSEKDEIRELQERVEQLSSLNAQIDAGIADLRNSTSWRITKPLRYIGIQLSRTRRLINLLPQALAKGGGFNTTVRKAVRILQREGVGGVRRRLGYLEAMRLNETARVHDLPLPRSMWRIIPHYVDPRTDGQKPKPLPAMSVAVHIHLYYTEMINELIERLSLIPCKFDLFVSIPVGIETLAIEHQLKSALQHLHALTIETVPNRGRNIAPLIVQFGSRLASYDIVGHFHLNRSPHAPQLNVRAAEIFDMLLGPVGSTGGRIAHFFDLLRTQAKIIYPERRTEILRDETGWGANRSIATELLARYSDISIDEFPVVEYADGAMFWARGESVASFLTLPLTFQDFPPEPMAPDGALTQALERLVFILAHKSSGELIRIHKRDSIKDFGQYEGRKDYSHDIIHDDVKLLAYYLPQFHPTPENDEWHGEGFTEWTKVRASNPLFEGHYQQHIPHSDIGYYLLDGPDTLRQQADLMKGAGIHGMVFYHYWFGGRMILEKPARTLLANADIEMPFCFCWANENWTRRWDGNEQEILLGQKYSPEDARDFIRYLIPFFTDERYVKIGGRPVLMVYRPSSIPDVETYIDIWAAECAASGVEAPFVVAVLTRGASHPEEFGMDAGVERVLHDWTGGVVPEMKGALSSYTEIRGTVLSYGDVADFYEKQIEVKGFTYFRSLVPMWDNTPRYGSDAYVLHGSTPARFQQWLETSIRYTKANLPADRRFILINAWNEWAEGAHLEPDTLHGYAYLNAVGRALSGQPYTAQLNAEAELDPSLRLHLEFPTHLRDALRANARWADRFYFLLRQSTIWTKCRVTVDPEIARLGDLPASPGAPLETDMRLEIREPCIFGPNTIEKMLRTALASKGAIVVPNSYLGDRPLLHVAAHGGVAVADTCDAPISLSLSEAPEGGYKGVRMRTDASCFLLPPSALDEPNLPVVTTIIRFHRTGDMELLRNALSCLAGMERCIVSPLIAAQDLSPDQTTNIEQMLKELPWFQGHEPRLEHFSSAGRSRDLRSHMLNASLRMVTTRYAAFLDYDDLLMPHAYKWLTDRLRETGKAVSFGRVFSTSYSTASYIRLERKRTYEYGGTFEEFLVHNHAPIHSFMLDMEKIDLTDIVHYDDQRYMEDYLLTMQIFTHENADWEGLNMNKYIGDYIHSIDRNHTLAFSQEEERRAIFNNPEYRLCEERISQMRIQMMRRHASRSETNKQPS